MAAAATFTGVMGLFNGGGRIFWGWLSERIGRMTAFVGMLAIQGVCFLILPHATAPVLFAVLGALIYLCYGGGFGTMPATAGGLLRPAQRRRDLRPDDRRAGASAGWSARCWWPP